MKKNFLSKFLSRKFLLALFGAIIFFLNGAYDIGIDRVEMLAIFGSILSYISVEGYIDLKKS